MSAARRLMRALEASATAAGCSVRVRTACEAPWSSATFVGARHAMVVEAKPTGALVDWLRGLPTVSLVVPGHVLAELAVRQHRSGARLDVLTLEAPAF